MKKEENDKKLEAKNSICKAIDDLTNNLPTTHNSWQQLITESRKLEEKWKSLGRLGKQILNYYISRDMHSTFSCNDISILSIFISRF